MPDGEVEEFTRVEHGRALDPRIEGIRGDRVERLRRRLQEVAGVVELHANLRVGDHVEVVLAEVRGHHLGDERLDFGDGLMLDGRID